MKSRDKAKMTVKKKKLLVISGLIVSVLIAVVMATFYFFPYVFWIQYARHEFPKNKINAFLYEKPAKRVSLSRAPNSEFSNHETFSYGNLVFKTAWPKARKIRKTTGRTGIWFRGPKALVLERPGAVSFAKEVTSMIKNRKLAEKIFKKQELKSNYLMHKQILEASLADAPHNKVEMVRMMTLTLLKSISYPAINSPGAFRFETRAIMGWQFGTPKKKPSVVGLSFYDRHDVLYEMLVKGMRQQEIDIIIQTMRER